MKMKDEVKEEEGAEKIVNLDYLCDRGKAAPEIRVEIAGARYGLRSVEILEDCIAVFAAADEFTKRGKKKSAKVEEMAAELSALRESIYDLVRVLVPDLPIEVLREKFPTLGDASRLFAHLMALVRTNAPEFLKKNSSGDNGNRKSH